MRANQDLQSALTEREVLVKEVHHQGQEQPSGRRQPASVAGEPAARRGRQRRLRESLNRVSAMSTIHELLYRSTTMADIDFAEVLRTLTGNLHDAYGLSDERISMFVEADPVPVSMDAAVPLALDRQRTDFQRVQARFPGWRRGRGAGRADAEGDAVVLRSRIRDRASCRRSVAPAWG